MRPARHRHLQEFAPAMAACIVTGIHSLRALCHVEAVVAWTRLAVAPTAPVIAAAPARRQP